MARLATTARTYREVMANASLRRAQIAFLLFNAAEYAVWIAVILYAYDQGGATTAGLVLLAQLLPAALIAPLASTLGDRIPRGRALVVGYLAQAVANLLLAAALWGGPPLLVYACAVIASMTITLTRPVHYAILPEIATTPAQLTAANSVAGTMEGVGILVGPITNSLLVAVSGLSVVVSVYAGVMLVAALLCLKIQGGERSASNEVSETPRRMLQDTAEALLVLSRDRPAGVLTLLGGSQHVVIGMLDVFYVLLAIDVLGDGEAAAGVLAAAVGFGALVGAGATAVLVGRRLLAEPIEVALFVAGATLAAVSLATGIGVAIVLLVVVGASRSFFDVAARTLLQRSVDGEVITRVFGLQEALIMLGLAVGAVLVPAMDSLFGPRGALVAAGCLFPTLGLASYGALRRLDRRAMLVDEALWSMLQAIPIFEPLRQYELEEVAAHLVPTTAPAGTVLIRKGDPGDRFYVVVAGEAFVGSDGRHIADLGAGDYFGEIALVRDVPRTASVIARTDVRLIALERDDFMASIAWGRRLSAAADAEVDRRLEELRRKGDERT